MKCIKCGHEIDGAECSSCGFSIISKSFFSLSIDEVSANTEKEVFNSYNTNPAKITHFSDEKNSDVQGQIKDHADVDHKDEGLKILQDLAKEKPTDTVYSTECTDDQTARAKAASSIPPQGPVINPVIENNKNMSDSNESPDNKTVNYSSNNNKHAASNSKSGRPIYGLVVILVVAIISVASIIIYSGMKKSSNEPTENNLKLSSESFPIENEIVSEELLDKTPKLTWGPQERSFFSWDNRAQYVTFNSINDNPYIGSETNFVRVCEYDEEIKSSHKDNIKIEAGKEYEVMIYYHNDAADSLFASGEGIAENVRIASSFPTRVTNGDRAVIRGAVSATNAKPNLVWDSAFLNSDGDYYLSYVPNSAVIHNSGETDGWYLSPEELFTSDYAVRTDSNSGSLICYYDSKDQLGVIPCGSGGFYAGYVSYRIKVEAADNVGGDSNDDEKMENVSAHNSLDLSWGPEDRSFFSWDEKPQYVTFNSIDNNPYIGSEANFVRVSEYNSGENSKHYDNITVSPGKEYEVWIYYHNDADETLNDTGKSIAQNTRIASSFPNKISKSTGGIIKGSVSSTKAQPEVVWDTAFLDSEEDVVLSFVPNSAVIHNTGETDGWSISSDTLFDSFENVGTNNTSGAMIAYYPNDDLLGVIPGGAEYAGYLSYRIKVEAEGIDKKTVGDIIQFGQYEQDGDVSNGKERIPWYILKKEDSRALLVTKECIELHNFSHKNAMRWSDSDLRTWLNKDFFDMAFSDKEKEQIMETDLITGYDSGGEDTTVYIKSEYEENTIDKVFILDMEENEILSTIESSGIYLTPYVSNKYLSSNNFSAEIVRRVQDNKLYTSWTRNVNLDHGVKCWERENTGGHINYGYCFRDPTSKYAVRPAIWVEY